jgi:hypothetical protein
VGRSGDNARVLHKKSKCRMIQEEEGRWPKSL